MPSWTAWVYINIDWDNTKYICETEKINSILDIPKKYPKDLTVQQTNVNNRIAGNIWARE